jgi:hypothetical protein
VLAVLAKRLDDVRGRGVRPAIPDDEMGGKIPGSPSLAQRRNNGAQLLEQIGEPLPFELRVGVHLRDARHIVMGVNGGGRSAGWIGKAGNAGERLPVR